MRKLLVLLASLSLTTPVMADPVIERWNTPHAMGCMLLRECKEDVNEVYSLLDISVEYPNTEEFTPQALEFNTLLVTLNQIGIKVFLADQKYFPQGHRGGVSYSN